jgi:Ca2+-binding RTX toxin-like protein
MSGADANANGVLDVNQWGSSMVFLSNPGQAAIQGYTLGPGNTLTRAVDVTDTQTTYATDVFALETMSINGVDFLIGASQTEQGVSAYRIDPNGLTATGSMGIAEGLGIMTPSDMEVVELAGRCFVVVASAPGDGIGQSGAITVLELLSNGSLAPTDHLIDTLDTRFGQVQSLEVVEANGRTFVIAAGGDDGLTVFVMLPNGRLQLIEVMADTFTTGLENVSAIAATEKSGALHLFAASEISAGVTELRMDVSGHGQTVIAHAGGGARNGTAADDILLGGAGNDSLSGGAGDDILEDGAGADTLTGGGDRDIFVLRADGQADVITDFDVSRDRLDLSDWPFLYDPWQLTITPTATGATITWRGEYLDLQTVNGQTLLAPQIINAIIKAPNRLPTLAEIGTGDSDQLLDGGATADNLQGGDGNDTLYGYDGRDTLRGFDGEDSLSGGGGNDSIEGGINRDTLDGGEGDDTLNGNGGFDFINGGDGKDVIDGGGGSDSLYGGRGHDTLDGGDGADQLYGDDGNDRMVGGEAPDRLYGGAGDDKLFGNSSQDRLWGEDGDDSLFGAGGFDMLDGGAGNDLLDGGLQADNLFGRDGNDTLKGGDGLDRLFGGQDDDWLDAGDGNDGLFGEFGNDTMFGGNGFDRFFGGPGNDLIFGGDDDDTVYGGSGFDTIDGGAGNDDLWGKFNADRFVFHDGHGNDTIHDFAAGNKNERIDLSGVSVLQTLSDIIGQNGAAAQVGDHVRIDTGGGNMIWLIDVDIADLDASDFVF